MGNNVSVALTTLSVEELEKRDMSSTNLLFLPPQGNEGEPVKVLAFASRNICYIASSRIDNKGTTKLFLCDDSGQLENEDFGLYLFYLYGIRVLFISRDAFDDVPARCEAYRMRPDLVLLFYPLNHVDEDVRLKVRLNALSLEWNVKAASIYGIVGRKYNFVAFSDEGEEVSTGESLYWQWRI